MKCTFCVILSVLIYAHNKNTQVIRLQRKYKDFRGQLYVLFFKHVSLAYIFVIFNIFLYRHSVLSHNYVI